MNKETASSNADTTKDYDYINEKRQGLFKFNLEVDFPILRKSDVVFSMRLTQQIQDYLKGDSKPDWVIPLEKIDDEDKGAIHSLPQLVRNYCVDLTRKPAYRLMVVQNFLYKKDTGRVNLDGTFCEILPNDAISAIQLLKSDPNYEKLQKSHFGRVIRIAEDRIKKLSDVTTAK